MASFDPSKPHQHVPKPGVATLTPPTGSLNGNGVNSPGGSQFSSPQFSAARKRILTEQHMEMFRGAPCHKDLIDFLGDLSISVLGKECLSTAEWTCVPPEKSQQEDVAEQNQEQEQQQDPASGAASPVDAAQGNSSSSPLTSDDDDLKPVTLRRVTPVVERLQQLASAAPPAERRAAVAADDAQHRFFCAVTPVLVDFFTQAHQWITDIPLERMHKSRFGNLAYRSWQTCLRAEAKPLAERIVAAAMEAMKTSEQADFAEMSPAAAAEVAEELVPYLFDAFGNATRIDYGTGHELHFVLLLFVLFKNGMLVPTPRTLAVVADAATDADNKKATSDNVVVTNCVLSEMVLVILDEYWCLMTRIQRHYRLEPAGSHGVWGLDDFHHINFILGAAQLSPAGSWSKDALTRPASQSSPAIIPDSPLPDSIPIARSCEEIAPRNFLFRAVNNIHRTKSGPFGEHSRVLHGVSGLQSWPRVLTGMIKMFEGEVMSKFLIMQHLLFGKTFAWPVQQ